MYSYRCRGWNERDRHMKRGKHMSGNKYEQKAIEIKIGWKPNEFI